MTSRLEAVFLVGLALLVGCHQEIVNPVSPEYPCGTRMHMCSSGKCCWNDQDCGGDVYSCPEGHCCFSGAGTAASKQKEPGR